MTLELGLRRYAWLGLFVWTLACGDDDPTPAPMDQPDAGKDAAVSDGGSPGPDEPTCGDRIAADDEECDDGNTDDGDGCSASCEVEDGWSCSDSGGSCEPCGDGEVTGEETCDDGNTDDDDGCSARCRIEDDWTCPVAGEPCEQCGNGELEPNERCDEGDSADGLGCSEDCREIQDHFSCPTPGEPCDECGDGEVSGAELCDDGNTDSGDGCVANCMAIEGGWACPDEGGTCTLCGDGELDMMNEECDDGNYQSGDGCSETCRKEEGAVCLQPGVLCSVCGNGFIEFIAIDDNGTPDDPSDDTYDTSDPDAREACDDGNQDDGDGCSASCSVEAGEDDLPWTCPVPGVACGRCGDGAVQAIESCDDGVDSGTGQPVSDDGCSADCTEVETGFSCPGDGGACAECGDGVLSPELEGCDDGNRLSGDGCDRTCQLETGLPWRCPAAGSSCELCGNGVHEDNEACDDGNREDGDGCSADCQTKQSGYNCYFEGFPCAECGDGVLQPGEQCDEGHAATPANLTAGCSNCQRVDPWICPVAGVSCELCGDGTIGSGDPLTAFETCDDGNTQSSDGCSAQCQIEAGYVCGDSGCTAAACGDGFVATGEECDDGNRLAGDGCSFLCRVEPGFTCTGGAGCRTTRCGDGIVEGQEACDDGGAVCSSGSVDTNGEPCVTQDEYDACKADGGTCASAGLDGCSSDCQLEDGYRCESGADSCERTYCGDGLVEGTEECDLAGATCTNTTDGGDPLNGTPCRTQMDIEACVAAGGTCQGGPFCDAPNTPALDGEPCITHEQFAACETAEPGVSGCLPLDANGCGLDCKLKTGFKCQAGLDCAYADATGDCCTPTYCGDGVLEGAEQCDDGGATCEGSGNTDLNGTACATEADFMACAGAGGACNSVADDGCALDCTIETFYRCRNEDGMPSACRPFVEYAPVRRFNVTNINPVGLNYNPDRRSFGGHKSQGSQLSIEMCLDGTVIDQGNTSGDRDNGTVFAPDMSVSELPVDCSENPGTVPCYDAPLRPDEVADSNMQAMRASTYDPVSGDYLFVHATNTADALLVQLPRDYDRTAPRVDIDRYGVELGFSAFGLTVGIDGDLHVLDQDTETIQVLPRRRDPDGVPLPAPDCSGEATPSAVNCTSFEATPDAGRAQPASSVNALDAIFSFPGEPLVGIFNEYTGAVEYTGQDAATGDPIANSNYFSIYDVTELEAPDRSALPGLLFSLGEGGTSYANAAQAAETAPDGGSFIICTFTSSEDCQLFSRVCETDADCPPGTLCNLDGASSVGVNYCNAPGAARDDVFEADRDTYKECASAGAQNGTDCTASATACEADEGTCDQVGQTLPIGLDVLANDTLSEAACVDPKFTLLAVCGDGVEQSYETSNPGSCPSDMEPMPRGTVTFDEGSGTITYDAPDDGSCGFFDTFTYTVDLGGGDVDTAQVRVAVSCVCGDGITDGNEQCDDGAFNGDPGTCVESCAGEPEDQVLARCSSECVLNVLCGDGYIVAPEECDDGAVCSSNGLLDGDPCTTPAQLQACEADGGTCAPQGGDGCSAVCTRESECGNGVTEVGEDCDDGPTGSDVCTANCLVRICGDGNLDANHPSDPEQCDDGNRRQGDGCDDTCQIESDCGNQVVEPGEDCDDGNIIPGDGCGSDCKVENVCGNGKAEGGETCDGDDVGSCPMVGAEQIACVNSAAGAPNICLCQNYCGDGRIGGTEECDDGAEGSDSCRGASPVEGEPCSEIRCGDAVVDEGETCDDGNTNPADGCSNSCQPPAQCGNGTEEGSEECDDGNNVSGDGCTATCQDEATNCGDGTVDADEQCDDGNTDAGDGCDANCRLEGVFCGDGTRDPGEECDDGNTESGDGCSFDCLAELL
ncbi:MAG: DUF4215 domain-containing protein [Myxococcales bacterium]|nr:DUF4215 domain-containing protein [Myxococcales bacterium]